MRSVTVADAAKDELRLITEYLSAFDRVTADSFAREYDRKWKMLAEGVVEFPAARHPELAAMGYRVALVKNYLMLYRVIAPDEVLIAHVFHQSQDYAPIVLGER